MEFLLGKHITEDLYEQLEGESDSSALERILTSAFELEYLDFQKRKILLKYYLRGYGFCRNNAFDFSKTSVFLSLIHEIWERDSRLHSDEINAESSCVFFEGMLQKHAVEKSPKSVKIFSREEVPLIYDFAMTNYYQHFQLFRYVFGVHARVFLVQTNRNDISEPAVPIPLSS